LRYRPGADARFSKELNIATVLAPTEVCRPI